MSTGLHVKYLLFLSDFNKTFIFSTYFRKNPRKSNFIEIPSVGAEFGRERERETERERERERQTDG
jgi:hypothetical protein